MFYCERCSIQRLYKSSTAAMWTCGTRLHVLGLLLVLLIIVIGVCLGFLVFLSFFGVFFLFLLGCFHLTQFLPLLGESVSLGNVISDNYVVEYGTCLDLPEIKTDETEIVKFVDGIIVDVLWVRDFFGFPNTFVCGVGYTLAIPITFVSSIVL